MIENQFYAWLLFVSPILFCFDNKIPFEYQIVLVVFMSIYLLLLFVIAENEFIKDCKKGYKNWEESILPIRMYKRYYDD